MSSEEWKKYIKNEKERYRNIGYAECPAFNNERVYFNNYGFDHIVYKGKGGRSKEEITKRLSLIVVARIILEESKSIFRERVSIRNTSKAFFYELRGCSKDGKVKICIVVRRLNDSKLHFFSIFPL